MQTEVKVWIEKINIPTYKIGEAEKNPMFLEKRVYQGSSGVVYPYPVVEKIFDEKEDVSYDAVFLENQYLKVMILPALGGRVQMAYDKVKERHFIYYNHAIKPALVGLTGPWISGGIEFNWPQHHRPSTFLPVEYTIEHGENGEQTVWVNEVEMMFRTKGRAGFRLYPGRAYLEIEAHLTNRTLFPQTFLWWANPAVKVNDHYQSIFPPDVHAVYDHGKRDVSSFPIAKGVYYKMDYAPGTDISRYKNIPVPTSFMAVNSTYDFMGGYEHDTQAGMLHVANHHVVPGKKQWTWGNADFGKAWDRNLTDTDGPYIELMTGAFTDNQPDFSWLQPNETKSFVQYFMPYSEIGVVKNANKDMAVHFDLQEGQLTLGVYASGVWEEARIVVTVGAKLILERTVTLSPSHSYQETLTNSDRYDALHDYELRVYDREGALLIRYAPERAEEKEIPPPATPAPDPKDVPSTEELYLHGLHLEQYRHATYDPRAYYQEALQRDPNDIRNNNAMGLWLLRRGLFTEAQVHFLAAKSRLLSRNTNPYDSEVLYNLGLLKKVNDALDEAYSLFYKATWNAAWKDTAYLMLARIDVGRSEFSSALEHIDHSLANNTTSGQAQHLRVVILRKLGRVEEAFSYANFSLELDAFNYAVYFEKYLLLKERNQEQEADSLISNTVALMNERSSTFIEYALDYVQAYCYEEALDWLGCLAESPDPLVHYHKGYIASLQARLDLAHSFFEKASRCSPDYCFPNRMEDMLALEKALTFNPNDAKAYYYLGNYWYDKRVHEKAIHCWEESVRIDAGFPTVKRNLALAFYNKKNESEKALRFLEEAFFLDRTDARILMELDQLYRLQQVTPHQRLSFLAQYGDLVEQRDDLYLERISLFNLLQRHDEAWQQLASRNFHPWEGGEGKVPGQYLVAGQELAKLALLENRLEEALDYLQAMLCYPPNLGEGKLPNTPENDIHYLTGLAYKRLEEETKAKAYFELATRGNDEPVQAIFYNDPQPDKIFYQGLAWIQLGDEEKARMVFNRLADFSAYHLHDVISIDYMAVSLPDLLVFEQDLSAKNHVHCLYMAGLAQLGLGNTDGAEHFFNQVLERNNSHLGAVLHKRMIGFLQRFDALCVPR
ncbi:DUF5107 domain-containing protein [Olivibacter sp. LS-1]|uniref:DUF5107 domain-containing protein n=1 Tax=Olivibacter sp. LS-1 TaxID=2592345 RepID=UPI0011EA9DCC|nr:DUF5107 domain-containing protein [Olivibacter sp. LS-1]QEL02608.1 DUF5107 domain-containing protein [Olivibacter sp. LS-1]